MAEIKYYGGGRTFALVLCTKKQTFHCQGCLFVSVSSFNAARQGTVHMSRLLRKESEICGRTSLLQVLHSLKTTFSRCFFVCRPCELDSTNPTELLELGRPQTRRRQANITNLLTVFSGYILTLRNLRNSPAQLKEGCFKDHRTEWCLLFH